MNAVAIKTSIYRWSNKMRHITIRVLRIVPGMARVMKVPVGRIPSLKEWIKQKRSNSEWSVRMHAPEYNVIHSSTYMPAPIPKRPSSDTPPSPCPPLMTRKRYVYWDKRSGFDARNGFCYRPFLEFDETFLAHLPNGQVVGPNGTVLTSDMKLVDESIWTWGDLLITDKTQSSWTLPAPEYINGPCYTVASIYAEGYPHWLLEVLPRLIGLKSLPEGVKPTIVFNRELNSWQKHSLAMFNLSDYPFLFLNERNIQSSNLFFPSYMGLSGSPHPHSLKWVKDTIMADVAPKADGGKRIFISRQLAKKRQLKNEAEIYPLLEQYGFEIVQAEKLSFEEQVALFAGAEAVVAPHGAGLANLLFVPKGCKVLELLDRDFVSDYYYNLAGILELDYYYQLGISINAKEGRPVKPGSDHFVVDAGEFQTSLEGMFADNKPPVLS